LFNDDHGADGNPEDIDEEDVDAERELEMKSLAGVCLIATRMKNPQARISILIAIVIERGPISCCFLSNYHGLFPYL
jgi:hypothetical protein